MYYFSGRLCNWRIMKRMHPGLDLFNSILWMPASLCRHELRFYVSVGVSLPTRTTYLFLCTNYVSISTRGEEEEDCATRSNSNNSIFSNLFYFFRTILLWTVFHSVPPGVDTDDDVVRWSWSWRSNGGANHNLFSHKASWWDSLQLSSIASSPISSCIINNTRGVYDIPFDHYHYPTPSDVDILFNCNNHHVQGHGYIKR